MTLRKNSLMSCMSADFFMMGSNTVPEQHSQPTLTFLGSKVYVWSGQKKKDLRWTWPEVGPHHSPAHWWSSTSPHPSATASHNSDNQSYIVFFCSVIKVRYIRLCIGGGSLLAFKIFRESSTICSSPVLFLKWRLALRTLIPLFMPGSVHSGSVSWDSCGWMFPDKLCVS